MKKVWVLCVFLLLAGCSNETSDMERGLALRAKLLQSNSCCFTADISADYGDKLHTFSMDCQADGRGRLDFTVTAPESIAGITGTVSEEGGKLTFDDTALHFELLADDQLSPASAPWIFLKTLRSGYVRAAGKEDELLRMTIDDSYEDDAMTLDIWLSREDRPQRAEILYDGKRILSLDVKNFEIT